jgi:hypothetical protein
MRKLTGLQDEHASENALSFSLVLLSAATSQMFLVLMATDASACSVPTGLYQQMCLVTAGMVKFSTAGVN